jgi:D-sedoheptulose 7-phosphate isomerase
MLIHQRTHHVKRIAANYLRLFEKLLHEIDLQAVERVVECLKLASHRRSTVYIAGNGGSAATASHWVKKR